MEIRLRSFTVFTIKVRPTEFALCNAARPDILITIDHGDFDLLSDVTSSPSLLTLKHRQKCIYLFHTSYPVLTF